MLGRHKCIGASGVNTCPQLGVWRLNHTRQRTPEVSGTNKTLEPCDRRAWGVINGCLEVQGLEPGQAEHGVGALGDSKRVWQQWGVDQRHENDGAQVDQ